MRTVLLILVFVLPAFGAGGGSKGVLRDVSAQGPQYAVLQDLRVDAYNVEFAGIQTLPVLGENVEMSRFLVRASVRVQTVCALGSTNVEVYEHVRVMFEVAVADDSARGIHDKLVSAAYGAWNSDELFADGLCFDFYANGDDYLLTASQSQPPKDAFVLTWLNGRVISIRLDSFVGGHEVGWGAFDSFVSENISFVLGNRTYKAVKFPLSVRKSFLKLYRAGRFANTRSN